MAIKWKLFDKTGGKRSKYFKYLERVVVITTERGFLLTPATIKLLGNPDGILLLHDGNGHIGFRPVKKTDPEIDNAFAVVHPKNAGNNATSVVNCKAFFQKHQINPKIVFSTVSVENDILVIDTDKYEVLRVNN